MADKNGIQSITNIIINVTPGFTVPGINAQGDAVNAVLAIPAGTANTTGTATDRNFAIVEFLPMRAFVSGNQDVVWSAQNAILWNNLLAVATVAAPAQPSNWGLDITVLEIAIVIFGP